MWAIKDGLTVARRNVIGLTRVPTTVVFSTIQPIIFVIMFTYVFGGAMAPFLASIGFAGNYVAFLMPGIFIQTVTFGSANTGIGLAEDIRKGLIERFRSLPMARSAVLAGRTIADTLRNAFVITLMFIVGFLVGFRMDTTVFRFLEAVLLMLLFGFAMSWFMALIGMSSGNAEAAQAASFPILAVLVFASGAFVPTASMPSWLQGFAEHQPVTVVAEAVRYLLIGWPPTGGPSTGGGPGAVLPAFIWCFALIAVFAPLAVRKYRKTA